MVLKDKSLLLSIREDCSKKSSKKHRGNLCIFEKEDEAGKLIEQIKLPLQRSTGYNIKARFHKGTRDLVVIAGRYDFMVADLVKSEVHGPFRPYSTQVVDSPDTTITFIGFEQNGKWLLGTSFDGRSFIFDIKDLDRVREVFAFQGRFHDNLGKRNTIQVEREKFFFVLEDFDSPGRFTGIEIWQIGKSLRGDITPHWTHSVIFEKRNLKTQNGSRKLEGIICGNSVSHDKCSKDEEVVKIFIDKDHDRISSPDLSGMLYPAGAINKRFELKGFVQESPEFREQRPNSMRAEITGKADLQKGTFTATLHTEKLVVERLGKDRYQHAFIVFTEELNKGMEKYLVLDIADNDYFELDGQGGLKEELTDHFLEQADTAAKHGRHRHEGNMLIKALLLDLENPQIRERLSRIGLESGNEKE